MILEKLQEFETIGVLDTETTGMLDFKADTHAEHQPHPVQLALKVYHKGDCVISDAYLIDSEFDSQPEALAVHGKTMELRKRFGIPYEVAMANFLQNSNRCDLLVAHNMNFDFRILQRAMRWCFVDGPDGDLDIKFAQIPTYCTMLAATPLLNIPGPRGVKWPKLEEAYCRMVNPLGFSGAHDAMVDVQACADVLFSIKNETWQTGLQQFQLFQRGNAIEGMGGVANA
jgi:DNA polymerase-3 subunit epsilon